MRLPLPLLLYVTALGLFGWAGWTVYNDLHLWKQDEWAARSSEGLEESSKLINAGRGSGPIIEDWDYARTDGWWKQLTKVNLIGKLPPPPKDPEGPGRKEPELPPPVDMTPLEDIFELVTLVYDGKSDGKGDNSHVIIRYKPGANVVPPEWWELENAPPQPGGARSAMPRDVARSAARRSGSIARAGTTPGRGASPTTTMPTASLTGREILQKLWVDDQGDERKSSKLWPEFEHLRLVRVAADAQSAFFVRTIPPTGDNTEPEEREEELLKTTMPISQDVLRELRVLQGGDGEGRDPAAVADSQPKSHQWRDVESTTRFGNEFHIGRKDEQRFRENADDFFNNVYVDTYVSKVSSRRGVQVRSIKPEIAQRFGVVQGDVLLEINNRKVESQAQAMKQVKSDYKRGVRTFSTKWLTADGQTVDRVYQAPDK